MNQVEFEESGESCLWEMNYEPDDPTCKHPLPGDWSMGGPTGSDPRQDPRWRPVTYLYLDRLLHVITMTQEPFCDHVAKGSYRQRVDTRGRKVYYITSAPEGRNGLLIYADAEGAMNAN